MKRYTLGLALGLLLVSCDNPVEPPDPDEQMRQELRALHQELDPMWEPTPFELSSGLDPSALPYDWEDSGGSGGDSWTYYNPVCRSGFGPAAGACAPSPGAIRSYTGVLTGSACLMAAAVTYCEVPIRQMANTYVKVQTYTWTAAAAVVYANYYWVKGQ